MAENTTLVIDTDNNSSKGNKREASVADEPPAGQIKLQKRKRKSSGEDMSSSAGCKVQWQAGVAH